MSPRRLIAAGTAAFLLGVVLNFPARVAYDLFAPSALRLSGLNGSIWKGSASEGDAGGLYLRNLRWTLKPLALLRGRLGLRVEVEPAGGILRSDLTLGFNGVVEFSDLDAGVSIGALQSLVPAPGIEGNLRIALSRLRLDNGFPSAVDGTVEVLSLVARGLSPTPIGDFRARLSTGDDAVTGSLEDLGGALDIAGSVRLGADRSYVLEGLVAPTPMASATIVNQLQFLGSANERGQRPFRFEGTL